MLDCLATSRNNLVDLDCKLEAVLRTMHQLVVYMVVELSYGHFSLRYELLEALLDQNQLHHQL